MSGKLTRRAFLHQGLLAALGAGLAACAGPQRLTDTPSVEPAAITPSADDTLVPAGLHEARYYLQLEGDRVQCQMCFRRCTVPEGGRGFCRNKANIRGRYYTFVYGRPSALQVDPIEKEPSFHMLPGATILCTGTASCNNRCKFCQNWHLSQRGFEEIDHLVMSPEDTIAVTQQRMYDAVSFTYNEPTVFYEHMFDVAQSTVKRAASEDAYSSTHLKHTRIIQL